MALFRAGQLLEANPPGIAQSLTRPFRCNRKALDDIYQGQECCGNVEEVDKRPSVYFDDSEVGEQLWIRYFVQA